MTTIRQPMARPRASAPVAKSRGVAASGSPSATAAASWVVSAVSGGCLAFAAFLLVLSPLQQARAQDVLYGQFRTELAAATAPFGAEPIMPGAPVAIIEIPALGVRQVVVEGTAGRDLRHGPGHDRASAFPGQPGVAVLLGRSTTYGAPFADVATLTDSDTISVVTGQGEFTYRVAGVRRDGDPAPVAPAVDAGALTLVTTEGDLLRPAATVYVDATLMGDPAVAPPRSATIVPSYEAPMAADPTALLPLTLWLLLLVGVSVFVVWGVLRWGRLQTWVVAAPVLLAALWGAADSAALLLPNLM